MKYYQTRKNRDYLETKEINHTMEKRNMDYGYTIVQNKLNPSILGRIFTFILLILFGQFHTASKIHLVINKVQTLTINILTFINCF